MISIVLPIYNSEKWISECVESILNQSYSLFELICVDDGSTDDSLRIIEAMSERDKRITIIKHPHNMGEGAARNTGIRQAKGDYIISVDSDDYLPEKALQILLENLLKHDSDIVVGGVDLVDVNKNIVHSHAVDKEYVNINPLEYPELSIFSTGYHWSMLYKRDIIYQNNILYKEDCVTSCDGYFLFTLVFYIKKMTIIPDIIYKYRQTPNSLARSKRNAHYLHDDINIYNLLYSKAQSDSAFQYATNRFHYRVNELFHTDLKRYYPYLSVDDKRDIFMSLASFFKKYDVADRLLEFYVYHDCIKIVTPLLIPFIFSLQSGNIDLCITIADAESLSQNSKRSDFITMNELARISFAARKYLPKQMKRMIAISKFFKKVNTPPAKAGGFD
jgi:glycosyltransferase involved in cell wall biosynthesis